MKREAAAQFIELNVLGSSEVQELLLVNKQRLAVLVKSGKLTPIKELKREKLFWLPDVEKLKSEMMLDTRSNLFKQGERKHA
jgi:hypothetical protein